MATYVRIVPGLENDFSGLYWVRKENTFLNTDRGNFWGSRTQANMFKSHNETITYAKAQGWLILPEPPEGFTVNYDQGVVKFVVVAQKRGETNQWLNHRMTGWTTNPIEAVTMQWSIAQAISDTYK